MGKIKALRTKKFFLGRNASVDKEIESHSDIVQTKTGKLLCAGDVRLVKTNWFFYEALVEWQSNQTGQWIGGRQNQVDSIDTRGCGEIVEIREKLPSRIKLRGKIIYKNIPSGSRVRARFRYSYDRYNYFYTDYQYLEDGQTYFEQEIRITKASDIENAIEIKSIQDLLNLSRKTGRVVAVLRTDLDVSGLESYLPIKVSGTILGADYTITGALSKPLFGDVSDALYIDNLNISGTCIGDNSFICSQVGLLSLRKCTINFQAGNGGCFIGETASGELRNCRFNGNVVSLGANGLIGNGGSITVLVDSYITGQIAVVGDGSASGSRLSIQNHAYNCVFDGTITDYWEDNYWANVGFLAAAPGGQTATRGIRTMVYGCINDYSTEKPYWTGRSKSIYGIGESAQDCGSWVVINLYGDTEKVMYGGVWSWYTLATHKNTYYLYSRFAQSCWQKTQNCYCQGGMYKDGEEYVKPLESVSGIPSEWDGDKVWHGSAPNLFVQNIMVQTLWYEPV